MLGSTISAPAPHLAHVVEAIWDVDVPDGDVARAQVVKILPTTSAVMVVHFRSPISSDRRNYENCAYKSVVTGIQKDTVTLQPSGPTGSVVVRFRPEAASRLFGAMAPFADANVELSDVVDAPALASLEDQLSAAPDRAVRSRVIQAFVQDRLRVGAADRCVDHAVRQLRRAPATPVSVLSHALGISERHLARRFGDAVGASPKQFARLARAEKVLAARWRGLAWADIALACGFNDQAHMIRDFKALTGLTPGAATRTALADERRKLNGALAMSGFYNTYFA